MADPHPPLQQATGLLVLVGFSDGDLGWEENEMRRGFPGSPPCGFAVGDQIPTAIPSSPLPPSLVRATPCSTPQACEKCTPVASPAPARGSTPTFPKLSAPRPASCQRPDWYNRNGFPMQYDDVWAHSHPSDANIRPLKRRTVPSSLLMPRAWHHTQENHHRPVAKYLLNLTWRTLSGRGLGPLSIVKILLSCSKTSFSERLQ